MITKLLEAVVTPLRNFQRGHAAYVRGMRLAQMCQEYSEGSNADRRRLRWLMRNSNRMYWLSRGRVPSTTVEKTPPRRGAKLISSYH